TALSLFCLVVAIGIVVADAIVVVENVGRNIARGLSPRAATYRAMREVSGPIIAIALTLVAVFVPLAFIRGLSGQFYKQFALTIAISTVISAVNSLTLSPALAALLLKAHSGKKNAFFRAFNRYFGASAQAYGRGVTGVLSRKAFDERKSPSMSGGAIAGQLNREFAAIPDAFIALFPPPPVQGLGTTGGFKLQIEDRASLGYEALDAATKGFLAKAYQTPELAGLFSSFQVNVPQLYADVDRTRARQLGVPVTEVFDTMQIYLGSLSVNDFNRFGRTYSVRVQAD